jgi:D-alanyl-lipoteichoic acid acyltransferase DltB (MBOAT superfamily)
MTDYQIDISDPLFWVTTLLAIVLLAPLTGRFSRRGVWAMINATFLVALTGSWSAVILGSALVVHILLRAAGAGRGGRAFLILLSLGTLGLFLVHKLPLIGLGSVEVHAKGALLAIGFSYVAARLVELLRAVWEGRHHAPDLPSTINYLLPFHMLAAGPIQSFDEFASQPDVPEPLQARDVLAAVERIAFGLFKKFVLAYAIHRLFLTDFASSGVYFVIEIQMFFLWLYLDFSAYSDIAVGVGRLMGIATPENFDRPYLARNVIDFWNRWHLSLSYFIRRNLFIPIQLLLMRRTEGRRPLLCASVAFTVSFVLCGLWHALTINFLIWGAVHAAGLVVVNLYRFWLNARLGAEGMKRYNSNRWIRAVAIVLTYEFVALSLLALYFP